ncbi:MAG: hypothetical protein GY863_02210 [bacterium]|nr:hypothetical protein [bacterium]
MKEDKYKSAFGYGNNIRINGYGSSVLTVSLNGKYILVEEGTNIPYLIFGVGLLKYSRDQMDIFEDNLKTDTILSDSDYSLGFNTGIGIELPVLLRFHLFGEIKYHFGFTDDFTHLIPIKIGFKFK